MSYRKPIILISLLFHFCSSLSSQPLLEWSRSVVNARAQFIFIDSSEYVYTAGLSDNSATSFSVYLNKFDSLGNQLWNVNPPFGNSGFGNVILDDSSNIYLTNSAHIYTDPSTTNCAAAIAKYNSSGNLIWSDEYRRNNFTTYNSGNDVVMDGSNGVWLKGLTEDSADSYQFDLMIKYTKGGQRIILVTDSLNPRGNAYKITVDALNNVYYAGSYANGNTSFVKVFKYDTNGNKIWQINDSSSASDNRVVDIKYFNSFIYLARENRLTRTGVAVQKYDLSGQLIASFTYEDSSSDLNLKEFFIGQAGNMYLAGETTNSNPDVFVIQVRRDTVLGYYTLIDGGMGQYDIFNGASLGEDEKIYLTGRANWDISNNYSEMFISMIDTSGVVQWLLLDHEANSTWEGGNDLVVIANKLYCIGTAYVPGIGPMEIIKKYSDIINSTTQNSLIYFSGFYPNPASDRIRFSLPLSSKDKAGLIKIFDLTGRECLSEKFIGKDSEIGVNNLSAGIYYCHILFSDQHFVGKIMIQN